MSNSNMAILPQLPYKFDELEPIISQDILTIHYTKHHQKYVDMYNHWLKELNKATSNNDLKNISKIIKNLNFNHGGHYAHLLYWENLIPTNNGGGVLPNNESYLGKSINETFGSFDNFISKFNKIAGEIQGSGWTWLALDQLTKKLCICYTEKHDSVEEDNKIPLLTVDVWEHAYYLQYKNDKVSYFNNIWKIVNWKVVEERYLKALSSIN